MSTESGYIDYFAVLSLEPGCKPGEVRRAYKKKMKDLVIEISHAQITEEKRDRYLLQMAQMNAAFFILRDNDLREKYEKDRVSVMELEETWRKEAEKDPGSAESDQLRRTFDGALRDFLSAYLEERLLEAGRDKECVEASNWDAAHERHAARVLRLSRQRLYHEIQERLPFYAVTPPRIDWEKRTAAVAALLAERAE